MRKCSLLIVGLAAGLVATAMAQESPTPMLAFDVEAPTPQPAGRPFLITLRAKNISRKTFFRSISGPVFLSADEFKVNVLDGQGREVPCVLEDGTLKNIPSSSIQGKLRPGGTVTTPTSLGLLAVGTYTVRVGKGKTAKIVVKDDAALVATWDQSLLQSDRLEQNYFPRFVTLHYDIQPVLHDLQGDLASSDVKAAYIAACTLQEMKELPSNLGPVVGSVMARQLSIVAENYNYARVCLRVILIDLARRIGTEDTLSPVLAFIHGQPDKNEAGETRVKIYTDAIGYLAAFPPERVTEELHNFLKRNDPALQITAAQLLASRHDPAAKELLLTVASEQPYYTTALAYFALLNFPDDPRVEAVIRRGLTSQDDSVRFQARCAYDRLAKADRP